MSDSDLGFLVFAGYLFGVAATLGAAFYVLASAVEDLRWRLGALTAVVNVFLKDQKPIP